MILELTKREAKEVALLHQNGITEGFLSTLGLKFLATLYLGIVQDPQSGVLVAKEDDEVLGYVAYSQDVGMMFKRVIKQNFWALSFALLPQVFNFSIYKKVLSTILYPFKKKNVAEMNEQLARAELLSIVVSDKARGKGIGKLLVAELDETLRAFEVNEYYVVTHGIDEQSNGFYRTCGFELVGTFENYGNIMNDYVKNFRVS